MQSNLTSVILLLLLGCSAGDRDLHEEERALRREPDAPNLLLRGEIARALLATPHHSLARSDFLRIIGSLGPTVEPAEVRDLEGLLRRMATDNLRGQHDGPLHTLGLPVTYALGGDIDGYHSGYFEPRAPAVPPDGTPLDAASLAEWLREGGVEGLRADVVIYAAHQFAVARANNAALRSAPHGRGFRVKGFTFYPTFRDWDEKLDSVTWPEERVIGSSRVDWYLARGADPEDQPGAGLKPGDLAPPDSVSAAEVGRYLAGQWPGIEPLLPFEAAVAGGAVPSPPHGIWAGILNPARMLGQRLRIASSLFDALDAHGPLLLEVMVNNRNIATGSVRIFRGRLTRALLEASLPSLLLHADIFQEIDWAGAFFLESNVLCPGPVCRVNPHYVFDARWHRDVAWQRLDELRWIAEATGEPVPIAHDDLIREGEELVLGGSASATPIHAWYASQGFEVEPSLTPPEALELPPARSPRPVGASTVALHDGREYAVASNLLFRDGHSVTPAGFELFHVTWAAFKDPLVHDAKIYFPYVRMPERFADRGTLVYDMAADTWLRTQSIDLVGYWAHSFRDGILTATHVHTGEVWTLDLTILPLVPATPPPPLGPFIE